MVQGGCASARQAYDKHRFHNLFLEHLGVVLEVLRNAQAAAKTGVDRHLRSVETEVIQPGFGIQSVYQAREGFAEVISAKVRQAGFFLCRFY